MGNNKKSAIDYRVSSLLSSRYSTQSRRSFLYRVSKASFALLGVSMAGTVPLFNIPSANATPPPGYPKKWMKCGLHAGEICFGPKCTTTLAGGTTFQWVQCCPIIEEDGSCTKTSCCTYTDICNVTALPADCTFAGGTTESDSPWCGDGSTSPLLCTIISCGGGYINPADCAKNCGPNPPIITITTPGQHVCGT
jgi:hypothetical protein